MPTPWDSAIRKNRIKQLAVAASKGFLDAPAWGLPLFQKMLFEFNRLSTVHKIGLTMAPFDKTTAPKGSEPNVQIDVSIGTHQFIVDGKPQRGSLPEGTNGFDIVGTTHPVIQGGEIISSFVFLPLEPSINGRNSRRVGTGVRLSIAVHELLHASGLREFDPGHSKGQNDPDLFMTLPDLNANFPPDGMPGDRISLGRNKFSPPNGGLSPLEITARTAGLIRDNWK